MVIEWILVFWINANQRAAIDHIEGFKTEEACQEDGDLLMRKPMGVAYYGEDHYQCIRRPK